MIASIPNNEAWKAVIDEYRSLPQLWKVKSNSYKNKGSRNKAWEELLISFKEVEPDATLDTLKKRIINMRTCYRRELKKKLRSERFGDEDIYEPKLWYFKEFEFLRDQETQLTETTYFDNEEDNDDLEESTKVIKKERLSYNGIEDCLNREVEHSERKKGRRTNEKDEAATYAESWAVSYRKLNEEQKLFAKKAIDEILILGQLNQLRLNSVIYTT